jgi:pSer/pThr/pTyr-binding forkhead associated (FHA) protein
MDPSWTTCPYCPSAAAPSRKPSHEEGTSLRETRISADDPGGLGKTKVMPAHGPSESPQSARIAGNDARIVGALVTYDLNKQGDLYPITEGKNYIGSGKSNDGPLCDICISQDSEMSREHALILYIRGEGFTLYDQRSTNGTWVEKKRVKETPLERFASFRTGKTTWHFVSFERDLRDPLESSQPDQDSKPGRRQAT